MNKVFGKFLVVGAMSLVLLAADGGGKSTNTQKAIKKPIAHYFAAGDFGRSAALKKAFYPSAMMFFRAQDGTLAGVSQPQWWARLDALTMPVKADKRDILVLDQADSIAMVKVVSAYPTHQFSDYMTLMELEDGWKIAAKIFHKKMPSDPASSAASDTSQKQAIQALIHTQIHAHETHDVGLLATVNHPRTMYISRLQGSLVGVSLAEWQARLASEKPSATAGKSNILAIDHDGSAGYAKYEIVDGASRAIHWASLLYIDQRWVIVNVACESAQP